MQRTKIRVFPDYCASALWNTPENGWDNLEYEDFEDVLPASNLIALKYWVRAWEMCNEKWHIGNAEEWEQDGLDIVDEMNKCQDKYEFVYVSSIYD